MKEAERFTLILYLVCIWGMALYFVLLGVISARRKEPAGIPFGEKVPAGELADVPAYNREMGRTWLLFSIPFWCAGLLYLKWSTVGFVLLFAAATLGQYWVRMRCQNTRQRYGTGKEA